MKFGFVSLDNQVQLFGFVTMRYSSLQWFVSLDNQVQLFGLDNQVQLRNIFKKLTMKTTEPYPAGAANRFCVNTYTCGGVPGITPLKIEHRQVTQSIRYS